MSAFTKHQVGRHRSNDSLWMAHGDKVYDVTDFAGRHPGGKDILLEYIRSAAGGDVADVMSGAHPHQHSRAAYTILEKYCIGELKDSRPPAKGSAKVSAKRGAPCPTGLEEDLTTSMSQGKKKEDVRSQRRGWREDELIDWSEPLVWQVGKLGKDYMEWVHSPVDHQIRFFNSDLMENLSMCSWYTVPSVWLPVMCYFFYAAIQSFNRVGAEILWPWLFGGMWITVWHMPVLFALGALTWSFFEYIVHRWVFHLQPPPGSPLLITLHFLIHGQHHKSPMDRNRLVFPPIPASVFAVFFIVLYKCMFPLAMAQSMLSGTALGYVFYDLMHYYLHHGDPKQAYLKDLKTYHIKHHYVNQQMGFGISMKLWDYPFGTVMPADTKAR